MVYEPKTIYKRGNRYILVLSTSSAGMHMMHVGHKDILYSKFPELEIDDIGYIEFGKIFFVHWKELNRRIETSVYKKMSERQYNAVVSVVSSMFTGDVIKHNGTFMYADEVPIEKVDEIEPTDVAKSDLPVEDLGGEEIAVPVPAEDTGAEEPQSNEADTKEECPITIDESTHEVPDTVESIDREEKSVPMTDNKQLALPKEEIPEMSPLIINEDDGSITYDLLYVSRDNSTNGSDSKYPAKRKKSVNKPIPARRRFTEDEALGIAASTTPAIMSRYGLSSSHASIARRNARKLFDFENKKHAMCNVKEIIIECESVEEAASKLNIPVCRVLDYKANYAANDNATTDGNDNLHAYVDNIIASRDYAKLHEFFTTSNHDICERFNATIAVTSNERIRVYHELALNPLYPVFGIDAFKPDLEEQLRSARTSNKSIILLDVYKKIMELWDVYYRTINIHSRFLNGIDDAAKYVNEENMDYFMSMVWNRFNRKRLIDSRIFSATQKAAIKNNDLYQFCTRFIVGPENGRVSLAQFRKSKLKPKEDKK